MAAVLYGSVGVLGFLLTLYLTAQFSGRSPGVPFLLGLWLLIAVLQIPTILLLEPTNGPTLLLANLAIYLFIVEAFIFVYAVALGSLSARVMVSMLEAGDDERAFDRTLEQYSATFFLNHRLQRLVDQGLLVCDGGRYYVTSRGRSWARITLLFKRALAVGAGG